jgi:hypothetical protein
VHDRRRDTYDVANVIPTRSFEKPLCSGNVVANKLFMMEAANLGVCAYKMGAPFHLFLPRTRLGDVFGDHPDLWMESAENGSVCGMLIDRYNLAQIPYFQTWKQVLSDQAGSAGDDNLPEWHTLHDRERLDSSQTSDAFLYRGLLFMQRFLSLIQTRLPVVAAVAFIAIILGTSVHRHGSLPLGFRAFRVDSTSPSFADTRTVTNSIDCLLSGQDPYTVRSFDFLNRVYNYPPIWLGLRYLGVTGRSTNLMAAMMAALFIVALLVLFNVRIWPGAILVFLALISRPVLFAIERGNTDLFIFSLLVFGFFLIERQRDEIKRICKAILIVILVVLKLFPIATVVVFIRNRRGLITALAVAALSLAAFLITSGRRVPLILRNTPQMTYFSYGAYPVLAAIVSPISWTIGQIVDHHHGIASVIAIFVACSSVAVGTAYRRRLYRFLPELNFDTPTGCIAISGLAIYLFSFVSGASFEYRLIFLLGPLAFLEESINRGDRLHALPASVLLVLFLVTRSEIHRLPNELLDAVVFIGSSAWLGTTLMANLQIPGRQTVLIDEIKCQLK